MCMRDDLTDRLRSQQHLQWLANVSSCLFQVETFVTIHCSGIRQGHAAQSNAHYFVVFLVFSTVTLAACFRSMAGGQGYFIFKPQ